MILNEFANYKIMAADNSCWQLLQHAMKPKIHWLPHLIPQTNAPNRWTSWCWLWILCWVRYGCLVHQCNDVYFVLHFIYFETWLWVLLFPVFSHLVNWFTCAPFLCKPHPAPCSLSDCLCILCVSVVHAAALFPQRCCLVSTSYASQLPAHTPRAGARF